MKAQSSSWYIELSVGCVHSDVDCAQMSGVSGQTQQQQIDSLLAEISDEVEIDARAAGSGPATNITDRLSRLNTSVTSGLLQTNCF